MADEHPGESGRCAHVEGVLADAAAREELLGRYRTVVRWGAQRAQEAGRPAKRRKLAAPVCGSCQLSLARPVVCLQCSYSGCWSNGHILNHLNREMHPFCVDAKSGFIYCRVCADFVYSPGIDDVRTAVVVSAEEKHTKFQVSKKPREPFQPWVPNPKETSALEDAIALPCQSRRGLLNLGQTCFLNVVLQSLLHNPLLRSYFLSDKHNHKLCKVKDCTCCEMDKLFSEIYAPSTPAPYAPTSFLATTWRASAELAGYAQQDAHEALIAALNSIHATARGSTNVSCICIVHAAFAGQLQSDVACGRCGNVTTTVDPMLDVSLELRGKEGGGKGEDTLVACLKRFTQPEKLGAKEYSCSKCKTSHESSKRLSIRKLPPVLSFQFKRFEHKSPDKSAAHKIDTPVRVPAALNMAPFTSGAVRAGAGEKDRDLGAGQTCAGPQAMYEYDLFAVINHEGQIDNGHYTNFARVQDEWYRFDDDKVTPASLGAVLACPAPAYMAFYAKRHLDYRAHVTPTYVVAREAEAVREREREGREGREGKEGKEVEGRVGREGKGGKGREKEKEEREREREREKEREREREREREEKEEKARMREVEDALLATV